MRMKELDVTFDRILQVDTMELPEMSRGKAKVAELLAHLLRQRLLHIKPGKTCQMG